MAVLRLVLRRLARRNHLRADLDGEAGRRRSAGMARRSSRHQSRRITAVELGAAHRSYRRINPAYAPVGITPCPSPDGYPKGPLRCEGNATGYALRGALAPDSHLDRGATGSSPTAAAFQLYPCVLLGAHSYEFASSEERSESCAQKVHCSTLVSVISLLDRNGREKSVLG